MKIKGFFYNVLLMVVSVVLALTIGEIVIRLIKPVYDYGDRSLLFSSPSFKRYSGGSVRYYPNEKIREIAVYSGKVEYDVLYFTNNLGFIDSKNYVRETVPGKRYYALVGDSFTAGVNSGSPWVPKLRNNNLNAEIYNFGVAGTGFEHFYRLLHDMKDKVSITHIVLVAITDDFFRGYFYPIVKDGNLYFCDENETGPHVPIAGIIPINASEKVVKELSKNKFKEIRARVNELRGERSLRSKLESILYDDSVIFYYTKVLIDTYKRSHQPGNIEYSMESMRKIRDEFPLAEIHLIHLPQKYEVSTQNYYINVAEQISGLGIKYYPALEKCNWSEDMFFTRDAHPNKYGYDNITKCVSDYLFK